MRKLVAVVLLFAAVPLSADDFLLETLAQTMNVEQFAEDRSEEEITRLIAYYATAEGQRALAAAIKPLHEKALRRATPGDSAVMTYRMRVRRTVSDMRSLATALEARATDEDEYPRGGDMAAIEALIASAYIRQVPRNDAWGNEFVYVGSPDGRHYRLISGGADGIIHPESRVYQGERRITDFPDDDLIFADGDFLQSPREMEPLRR